MVDGIMIYLRHHAEQPTFVEVCYCVPISFLEESFVGQLVVKVENCSRSLCVDFVQFVEYFRGAAS